MENCYFNVVYSPPQCAMKIVYCGNAVIIIINFVDGFVSLF